jgi:uncharacterized membrane protein YfcA
LTTQQVYLFSGLYHVLFAVLAILTRATAKRILGAVVGGAVGGVALIAILALGEDVGWWHMAITWKPYFLTLLDIGMAISGLIFLITWRIARRIPARLVLRPAGEWMKAGACPTWAGQVWGKSTTWRTSLAGLSMTPTALICLVSVFFLTAVISVVTGGTSLITVPVLMQFGIDPHVSVATNMLALIFLSLGGTLPFLKRQSLHQKRLPALIGLTLVASTLGALLLLVVPSKAMPLVIALAMIGVAVFSLVKPEAGLSAAPDKPSGRLEAAGYIATFVLGVYGGFFSGGYVILLTAAYVAFFRMSFVEAVAVTKVLNFFSSLVAAFVFAALGLIDWNLGVFLSAAAFAGGVVGAALAERISNVWLRRVFLTAVVALAVKTLLFDVARILG